MTETVTKEIDLLTVYDIDVLFPTEDTDAPGRMHISVLPPRKQVRITVLVEVFKGASLRRYIGAIAVVLQRELFNRINVDVRSEKDVAIFFKTEDREHDDFTSKYVRLISSGGADYFLPVDDIEA